MHVLSHSLLLSVLFTCIAVACTEYATKEDVIALTNKLETMEANINKQLQYVLETVLNKLGSSSSLAVSAKSIDTTPLPRDCADVMANDAKTSGVYTVYVGITKRPVQVYCDMTTDGGGWTVFQRRQDGSEDFYRKWTDYEKGFGNANGEHWLGNDILHRLTFSGRTYRLRVDLADWYGNTRYAEYSNFKVASACEKYTLVSVGAYCGTAGDSLTYHAGRKFSTFDQDNDSCGVANCAVGAGAWWFGYCANSHLNGRYLRGPQTTGNGVFWEHWKGNKYSLKFAEMKIRPVDM